MAADPQHLNRFFIRCLELPLSPSSGDGESWLATWPADRESAVTERKERLWPTIQAMTTISLRQAVILSLKFSYRSQQFRCHL